MSSITNYIPCRISVNLIEVSEIYDTAVFKGRERTRVLECLLRTRKKLDNDPRINSTYISKYTKKLHSRAEVEQACECGYCIITVKYADKEYFYAYSGI